MDSLDQKTSGISQDIQNGKHDVSEHNDIGELDLCDENNVIEENVGICERNDIENPCDDGDDDDDDDDEDDEDDEDDDDEDDDDDDDNSEDDDEDGFNEANSSVQSDSGAVIDTLLDRLKASGSMTSRSSLKARNRRSKALSFYSSVPLDELIEVQGQEENENEYESVNLLKNRMSVRRKHIGVERERSDQTLLRTKAMLNQLRKV